MRAYGWTVNPDHTITAADGLCLDAAGAGDVAPGTPGDHLAVQRPREPAVDVPRQRHHHRRPVGTLPRHHARALATRDRGRAVDVQRRRRTSGGRTSAAAVSVLDDHSTVAGAAGTHRRPTAGASSSLPPARPPDQQWTFVSDGHLAAARGLLRNAYDDTCLQASSQCHAAAASVIPRTTPSSGSSSPRRRAFPDQPTAVADREPRLRRPLLNAPATPDQSGPAVLGACSATNPQWRITPNLTAPLPARADHPLRSPRRDRVSGSVVSPRARRPSRRRARGSIRSSHR